MPYSSFGQETAQKVIKMAYHGNQHTKAENDNHANQLNPEHDAYWQSRGYTVVTEDEEEED